MDIKPSTQNKDTIIFFDDGTADVHRYSPVSKRRHVCNLKLLPEQARRWWNCGEHIQNACPHLTSEEREFMISGSTPEDWKKLFGGDDD